MSADRRTETTDHREMKGLKKMQKHLKHLAADDPRRLAFNRAYANLCAALRRWDHLESTK